MTKTAPRWRHMYTIDTRGGVNPELHPCVHEELLRMKCPRKGCSNTSNAWDNDPCPIDLVVTSDPQGMLDLAIDPLDPVTHATVVPGSLLMFHEEFLGLLRPYCERIIFGSVAVRSPDDSSERVVPYSTVAARMKDRIITTRGKYCRHNIPCPLCGRAGNFIAWARSGALNKSLDDRLVYLNEDMNFLIVDALYKKLELRKRFPKLIFEKVDILEKPQNGEVLPGDPEWDGVFRSMPIPNYPYRQNEIIYYVPRDGFPP